MDKDEWLRRTPVPPRKKKVARHQATTIDFNAAAEVAKQRAKAAIDEPSDADARRIGLLVTIQSLSDMGFRNAEIAKVLGKNKRDIDKVLDGGSGALARLMLASHAPRFAELWVEAAEEAAKKGNHVPAADALSAVTDIKSTKDVPQAPSFTIQFGIGLNLPGLPQSAAAAEPTSDGFPAIEARTVEVAR